MRYFFLLVALLLVSVLAVDNIRIDLDPAGNFEILGFFHKAAGGDPHTCGPGCPADGQYSRQIRWGVQVGMDCTSCNPPLYRNGQSGFGWRQFRNTIPADGNWYEIGEFAHINNPILIPGCDLTNRFKFTLSALWGNQRQQTNQFSFEFNHVETCSVGPGEGCWGGGDPNGIQDCWCGSGSCNCRSCPDRVTFEGPITKWSSNGPYRIDGKLYHCAEIRIQRQTFWTREVHINPQPIEARVCEPVCPYSCTGPSPDGVCKRQDCVNDACKRDIVWDQDPRCPPRATDVCKRQQCVNGVCRTDLPSDSDPRCPSAPSPAPNYCRWTKCDPVQGICRSDWIVNTDDRCRTEFLPDAPLSGKAQRECYDGFCVPNAGHCNLQCIAGTASEEKGRCPIPNGPHGPYDPRCAGPYCNNNCQCAVQLYSGTPHGSPQGYNPGYRPNNPNGPCPIPPQYNPQCWFPRCDNGYCGGEPWNFNKSCTPKPEEVDTVHNPQCIYYVCGDTPAEYGKCVSRVYPGNRFKTCVDDELCSWDWCQDGFCTDHEWKRCGTHEGICVETHCDPATGECTKPVRNGNACCPNGEINTGEECEPGINGADEQCCKDCYLVDGPCNDGNECTVDTCVQGRCSSRFQEKVCDQQDPEDICGIIKCVPDPDKLGVCKRLPDPTKNGVECREDRVNCSRFICQDGECVRVLDEAALGQPCDDPEGGKSDHVCARYTCQPGPHGWGECLLDVDTTQSCADEDLCNEEHCAVDEEGNPTCVVTATVDCSGQPPICHGPRVCDPKTGQCGPWEKLSDTPCTPENFNESALDPRDHCRNYTCLHGECVRSCFCGNGILEPGEACDWAIPHQSACCDENCQGCYCGNGVLDEGEECDYNIPEQTGCCNASCLGCHCPNGVLDEGEECDPLIPEHADCCNATCQGCLAPAVASSSASAAVIPGVVAAGVGLALIAAAVAVYFAANSGPAPAGAAPFVDMAGAISADNPLYVASASGGTNPLYVAPGM